MTGPEHYEEAERILSVVDTAVNANTQEDISGALAAAQVHATLALAAATAWTHWEDGEPNYGEYGGVQR